MKELITYIVQNLVERPDAVVVNEVAGDKAQLYEVRVDHNDLGKVIGKQGRTIRSVRALVSAAASRDGKRATVEVVD
jgi:predicted RNA-binding protein YlqC (UPF0109 family)